jgi:hypothetical protein
VAVLAAALAACASRPQAPETPEDRPFLSCRQAAADEVPVLDAARRRLHETTCGAALWFDGLFGEGNLEEARRTHGRIEAAYGGSELQDWQARLRFHLRTRLPALKERLSVFVGRDDEQEVRQDRSEGFALRQFPDVDDEEEWLAGLGYSLPGAYRVRTDFKVGARSLRRPKAFAQARLSYTPYADTRNLVHLRTTPFVNNLDGFGATQTVDLTRTLSERYVLRWGSIGTVTEKSEGMLWRSALILYHNLLASRAIAYEAYLRGNTVDDDVPVKEYGARAIYRQPLLRERLWIELASGYGWVRTSAARPREGSFGAGLSVEMPFGSEP